MKKAHLIFAIFLSFQAYSQSVTVSGFVTEKETGEHIPYANVSVHATDEGAVSNAYGFYSLTIPTNTSSELTFSHVGYRRSIIIITPVRDTTINIGLETAINLLREVEILEGMDFRPNSLNHQRINPDLIQKSPALLGENDLFKVIQLLPGVQRGIEGSNAFYVRGGGADQNLIILDEATVYNANHLFGFLSVFNPDAIKDVNFYKGSYPARYGGRIASVTDIQMKDGNKNKIKAEGGIGILSGRLTVDGPLCKHGSTFMVSGRRSFIDLLTRPFMSSDDREGYRFYDSNIKTSFKVDQKNTLLVTAYFGGDNIATRQRETRQQSSIQSDTNLGWANRNGSVRWNHILCDKVFSNTSLIYSQYDFFLTDSYRRSGSSPNYSYSEYLSQIKDYTIKHDVDIYLSNSHTLKSGISMAIHAFRPRAFYSKDEAHSEETRNSQSYETREFTLFVDDGWRISERMVVDIGMRAGYVVTKDKIYTVLEPRMQAHYSLPNRITFNAGYARTNQFMHLLSNTGVGLPTDLWVPVTSNAPPQQGDQLSGGVSKWFQINNSQYLVSIESYRRFLRNIITYKQDAEFLDTDELSNEMQWENNITTGKGESYGTELFIEKKSGRLQGWLGYTISWVAHEFPGINSGKPFFPKHDSRHNIVLYGSYNASDKVSLTASWIFATGSAMTVPHGYYYANFSTSSRLIPIQLPDGSYGTFEDDGMGRAPYAGSVNSFRGDNYHRLDVSVRLHRKKKSYERYWEFGLFNAYNRKNPYYYYLEASNDFVNQGQRYELKKKALFPILPSVSYNFKF